MKRRAWLLTAAALVVLAGCTPAEETNEGTGSTTTTPAGGTGGAGGSGGIPDPDPEPATPFALVELFTSEGCSSCPPAEDILADVVAQNADRRVFPIAWHVDYWNYLGWPDPYSSSRYTDRQGDYAQAAGSNQLVTPQFVINADNKTFNQSVVFSNIETSLGVQMSASVTLWLDQVEPSLIVQYRVADAPPDAHLNLVLVEGGIFSEVTAGENHGKTLYHAATVRSWITFIPPGDGQMEVTYTPDVQLQNARLIGFVQTPGTMALHGATSVDALVPYR